MQDDNELVPCPYCGRKITKGLLARVLDPEDKDYSCPEYKAPVSN